MATNNAVNQLKPFASFFAYLSADTGAITGDGTVATVPFNSELHDETSSFNTGTYTFTAPTTGKYLVAAQCYVSPLAGKTSTTMTIVTTARSYKVGMNLTPIAQGGSTVGSIQNTTLVDMTAGDTMYLTIAVGGGALDLHVTGLRNYSWLSCTFID